MIVQSEVAEKHRARKNHSAGVGLVLALDIKTNMTTSRLEHGHVAAHVTARNHARSSDQGSADIGQDASVQVRHDHHIELLRTRDSLHRRIVDDHIVDLEGGVVLSNLVESATEETVGELHDVCLVNAGDFLPVVCKRKPEGKLSNALGLGASDNLEGFHDALH